MEATAMVRMTGSEGLNCAVSQRWAVKGGLPKCGYTGFEKLGRILDSLNSNGSFRGQLLNPNFEIPECSQLPGIVDKKTDPER